MPKSMTMPVRSRYGRAIRPRGTGAAIATLALLLGCNASARAAGLKVVPLAQFRSDVVRLQQLVAACKSSAAACDPAQVGPDEQVDEAGRETRGGRSFEVHWQWLRESLKPRPTTETAREAELRSAAAQLNDIAQESEAAGLSATQQQSFRRARVAADDVLTQPEFQGAYGPTWWDRQKARLFQLLARIFGGVGRLGRAAPWIGELLEWLLFTGAAVGLLSFVIRNAVRQRLRFASAGSTARTTAWDREATDWERLAYSHSASGEWRDAVHCLYWAAIVLLESRRAWRHNPARTPREYVLLLRAKSVQQDSLHRLTRIFERVWYGLRDASAEEYAQARGLYEALAEGAEGSGRPANSGSTAAAADAAGLA